MKQTIITLLFLTLAVSLNAQCEAEGSINLEWTAFKTPKKVGVSGGFNDIRLTINQSAPSAAELLRGAEVVIKSNSVFSGHTQRDRKLVAAFFNLTVGDIITARVVKSSGDNAKGEVTVSLTLNGVTKDVPMRYTVSKEAIFANGVIDLFDFAMQRPLRELNRACYELHQGKTWSDIAITFTLPLKKGCRGE